MFGLSKKQWLALLGCCLLFVLAAGWQVKNRMALHISYQQLDSGESKVASAIGFSDVLRLQLQASPGMQVQVYLDHYQRGELLHHHHLGQLDVAQRQTWLYIAWKRLSARQAEQWTIAMGEQRHVTEIPLPERIELSAGRWGHDAILQPEDPQVLYARAMGWESTVGFGEGVLYGVAEDWQRLMENEDAFVLQLLLIPRQKGDSYAQA